MTFSPQGEEKVLYASYFTINSDKVQQVDA